jgi:hypothetical protein
MSERPVKGSVPLRIDCIGDGVAVCLAGETPAAVRAGAALPGNRLDRG